MTTQPGLGHDSRDAAITIEIRAFNSMTQYCSRNQIAAPRSYPADTTHSDVVRDLDVPESEIFLILVNGRDFAPAR